VKKIGPLLVGIREAERRLADDFQAVAARHEADQDVHHLCHTFARQCLDHAERLTPFAQGTDSWGASLDVTDRGAGELLDDLRRLFLAAENVSIQWVMAGQAAQAERDRALLQLVSECHTETEIQVKALVTHIKVSSPQALTIG
jgi:hypothetical protein